MIADGRTVSEVAKDWGVRRRTMHRWLARYEGEGLEGPDDSSHRPAPDAWAGAEEQLMTGPNGTAARVIADETRSAESVHGLSTLEPDLRSNGLGRKSARLEG